MNVLPFVLSAEDTYRSYYRFCPNIFIPEVLEIIREADELVFVAQRTGTNRPIVLQALSWLRFYRFSTKGRLGWRTRHPWLDPQKVHDALGRAVLDVAEELLVERKMPFSARSPSFIFTGRIADQSKISRRTIQEVFAAAKVRRLPHPDGEAWALQEAEQALADAGWVWVNSKPTRNPKGAGGRIVLQGGSPSWGRTLSVHFGPPDPNLGRHLLRDTEMVCFRANHVELHPSGKQLPTSRRALEDLDAMGVLLPLGNFSVQEWVPAEPVRRRAARKICRGRGWRPGGITPHDAGIYKSI